MVRVDEPGDGSDLQYLETKAVMLDEAPAGY
jgi:hypothetical protein